MVRPGERELRPFERKVTGRRIADELPTVSVDERDHLSR